MGWESPIEMYTRKHGEAAQQELQREAEVIAAKIIGEIEADREARAITGYKLFRVRDDGTIGPLFINRQQVVELGTWYCAEEHLTPGFAFRPGWHAAFEPVAPHLKLQLKNGERRVWFRVQLLDCEQYERPESQGGTWVVAKHIRVLEEVH